MINFKKLVLITFTFHSSFCFATNCTGVTVENAYSENEFVIMAEVVSVALSHEQYVDHYLKQRKGLNGYRKKEELKKAEEKWLEYKKKQNGTYLYAKTSFKGTISSGSIIRAIDLQDLKFEIGKQYIVFLNKSYRESELYLPDSCVYFRFSEKQYIQQDSLISGAGTFEGAIDNLMQLYADETQKNNK